MGLNKDRVRPPRVGVRPGGPAPNPLVPHSGKGPGMTTDHALNWALHLASRDWAVFPLAPGTKRPAIREWEHRATTDPKRIKGCWYAGAGYGIGIATGPSRLVVLDLDPADTAGPDGAGGLAGVGGGVEVEHDQA